MVMLKNGLNKIRDIHKDEIDKGKMGTDGSAVSESQTDLQGPVITSKQTATVDNSADKTNVIEYTCPSTTATGYTFREFAFLKDGDIVYNRVTFTGIEHTDNEDIVVRQTVFYRNP